MNKSMCLSLILALAGCASQPKGFDLKNESRERDFDRASHMLEHEDFNGAADAFDRLLVKNPGSETDLMAIYNSGAAYEGLGQCAKASERYREAVRSSANKFSRLESQSLYRLSLMYECTGQDAKAIAAMFDARKRAGDLAPEIARAELPARLAAAYARLGQRQKAVEFFGQASEGLKQILADASTSRRQKELLGQTLFQMGRLNPAQRDATGDPQAFLLSLSMQQPYLLQAIELAPPKWSRRAQEDLITAYNNIGAYTLKPEDRHAYGVRALQVIAELRKIRMPDAGALEDQVFGYVDKAERFVRNQLSEGGATTKLTPEARQREGVKRQGRPVNPKGQ